MDAQTFRQGRISRPVVVAAIAAIVALTALTAADVLRRTPRPVATHEASSVSSPIRAVAAAPRLVSHAEARFLVRRGATAAELAAENQQRWDRLQLRMLGDRWVLGLLRHRPGMTLVDLVSVYLSRR
jgi:hypothetical protein